MDKQLAPNRSAPVQGPATGREIPIPLPYYPNLAQFGGAGRWVPHPADGQVFGRDQLSESVVLPWLENAPQAGQHRRVVAPNSCPAASSNPFLDVCSAEIDSGRPLTDLIMDGSTSGGVSHNEQAAHNEVPPVVKVNKKRSKNFTPQEDELLVSAWLNVSMDPVRGANQTKDSYWKRIYDYFHLKKDFDSDRTQSSLTSRWNSILHDCNIFAGCVSKIEARNQSGASIDDKQANALAMYKNDDPLNRSFQYIQCWRILKNHSKWTNRRQPTGPQKPFSKKQKTSTESTHGNDEPDPVTGSVDETETTITKVERPTGNKKEKLKLKQRSSLEALDLLLAKKKEVDDEKELKRKERELKKEERELKKEERELKKQEMCEKAIALQEERIKLDKDKFEFERDQEEERIMNIDMSTLSSRQQLFYDDKQKKILARRLGN